MYGFWLDRLLEVEPLSFDKGRRLANVALHEISLLCDTGLNSFANT